MERVNASITTTATNATTFATASASTYGLTNTSTRWWRSIEVSVVGGRSVEVNVDAFFWK